jgi:hypothetical protein
MLPSRPESASDPLRWIHDGAGMATESNPHWSVLTQNVPLQSSICATQALSQHGIKHPPDGKCLHSDCCWVTSDSLRLVNAPPSQEGLQTPLFYEPTRPWPQPCFKPHAALASVLIQTLAGSPGTHYAGFISRPAWAGNSLPQSNRRRGGRWVRPQHNSCAPPPSHTITAERQFPSTGTYSGMQSNLHGFRDIEDKIRQAEACYIEEHW